MVRFRLSYSGSAVFLDPTQNDSGAKDIINTCMGIFDALDHGYYLLGSDSVAPSV